MFYVSLVASMAQEQRQVEFIASEADLEVLKKYPISLQGKDSLAIWQLLSDVKIDLHRSGYLTAGFDTVHFFPGLVRVHAWLGKPYSLARLTIEEESKPLFNKIGYRERFYQKKPFNQHEVAALMEKAITYSENNGYPFASLTMRDVQVSDNQIEAVLDYSSGPLITFDSIAIEGNAKIKPRFLHTLLRLNPGEPYDESQVNAAFSRLKTLPYVKVKRPPTVTFQNEQAIVSFELEARKSNQIDGIIGFLPNEAQDRKVLLTGEFNLHLQNLMGTGKSLMVQWQKLKPLSQYLELQYDHPNLFKTVLDVSGGLNLLKEDTSFINRTFNLSIAHRAGKYGKLRFYTQYKTGNLIATAQYKDAIRLPDLADFKLTVYGLGYGLVKLDDLLWPTAGYTLSIDADAGNKRILRNSGLDERLYQDITRNNLQVSARLSVAKFTRITNRNILLTRLQGALTASKRLFLNDLYRVGGLNSLRGFNENFFFASEYLVTTIEKRFLMSQTSYLLLFYDQSYIHYALDNKQYRDYPLGLGAGINFETNGGIFTFVFAVGKNQEQGLSLNYSKIHFGYISRF